MPHPLRRFVAIVIPLLACGALAAGEGGGPLPEHPSDGKEAVAERAAEARRRRGLDRDSELANPERFDEAKDRRDPERYIRGHVPSRVWVTKAGGPGRAHARCARPRQLRAEAGRAHHLAGQGLLRGRR